MVLNQEAYQSSGDDAHHHDFCQDHRPAPELNIDRYFE